MIEQSAEPSPLNKNCLTNNLIYKTTITTDNTIKNYTGSTSTTLKDKFIKQASIKTKKMQHITIKQFMGIKR